MIGPRWPNQGRREGGLSLPLVFLSKKPYSLFHHYFRRPPPPASSCLYPIFFVSSLFPSRPLSLSCALSLCLCLSLSPLSITTGNHAISSSSHSTMTHASPLWSGGIDHPRSSWAASKSQWWQCVQRVVSSQRWIAILWRVGWRFLVPTGSS